MGNAGSGASQHKPSQDQLGILGPAAGDKHLQDLFDGVDAQHGVGPDFKIEDFDASTEQSSAALESFFLSSDEEDAEDAGGDWSRDRQGHGSGIEANNAVFGDISDVLPLTSPAQCSAAGAAAGAAVVAARVAATAAVMAIAAAHSAENASAVARQAAAAEQAAVRAQLRSLREALRASAARMQRSAPCVHQCQPARGPPAPAGALLHACGCACGALPNAAFLQAKAAVTATARRVSQLEAKAVAQAAALQRTASPLSALPPPPVPGRAQVPGAGPLPNDDAIIVAAKRRARQLKAEGRYADAIAVMRGAKAKAASLRTRVGRGPPCTPGAVTPRPQLARAASMPLPRLLGWFEALSAPAVERAAEAPPAAPSRSPQQQRLEDDLGLFFD
eukprot:g3861.t1